jgi:hypothetical protein
MRGKMQKMDLHEMVDKSKSELRHELEEIAAAHKIIECGEMVGKVVLRVGS